MAGACSVEQSQEVAALKVEFTGECRVIRDVGDFTHVISIKTTNDVVSLKFQLTGKYPSVPPTLILQSKHLPEGEQKKLQDILLSMCGELTGKPMIKQLYKVACDWLESQSLHELLVDTPEVKQKSKHGKKQKKKPKKPQEDEPDVVDEKKKAMRTADDVIKRILWDESLPTEDFIVGYIDRFSGIVEKQFSSFSWEDIASVDYDVLAVPKHRIQYFKYKKVKIWDKVSRLDDFYGSLGGKAITDVMLHYKEEEHTENEPIDDELQIVTGAERDHVAKFEDKRLRPNYFFCVRVQDTEVCESVAAMQDALLEGELQYADCCIPPSCLHMTLCTVGLDTNDQIAKATHMLHKYKDELAQRNDITFKLEGVDNFYNRVLYAKVHHDQDLINFVTHFKSLVTKEGIDIRDNYDFVPHMTIMKTSRPVSRTMHTKYIDPAAYAGFTDMHFGSQKVDAVYLCSMSAERDDEGFYVSPAHIELHKHAE